MMSPGFNSFSSLKFIDSGQQQHVAQVPNRSTLPGMKYAPNKLAPSSYPIGSLEQESNCSHFL